MRLHDLAFVLGPYRQGTGDVRDQHAVDLPGDVALEAADDLSLALAFCGAPCNVLLCATVSSHPSQTDHVQRTVGVPVATSVEAVTHYLSRGGFHGRHSAETGEGGLTPQPLGIVPGHDHVRRGVVGTDACQRDQLWATCATSRSRCASSSAISAER